jgi:NitT/TauT family transport system ATP-binding protein
MQPLANVTPLKPAHRAGSIEIRNVGQIFKTSSQDVEALSDVSLEVNPAASWCWLAPAAAASPRC